MVTIKKLVLLAAIVLVLCIGLATADTGEPQVPETQGFVTSTAMSAIGTVTETDSIVNIIANEGQPTLPFPLDGPWSVIYTSSYTENTIADQGLVTYTKGMTTDTSGAATTNLYNVQTDKVVEFIGTDTGRMTSDERTVLDGAGSQFFYESPFLICPFAGQADSVHSPFCNIVEEGSSVDLTLGSLTTATAQRYIMLSAGPIFGEPGNADVPVSDPGVESDYQIELTGFGDIPAMGSAEAFINVHLQEGRQLIEFPTGPDSTPKAEDVLYSETSTASGEITLFQKVMSYNSKITQPGTVITIQPNNL
jgi:hypothetical protein